MGGGGRESARERERAREREGERDTRHLLARLPQLGAATLHVEEDHLRPAVHRVRLAPLDLRGRGREREIVRTRERAHESARKREAE